MMSVLSGRAATLLLCAGLFHTGPALAEHQSVAVAKWNQPVEPYRIAGNLYSVGTNELGAFLIATPEGHILINSNYEESVPLLRAAVEKLGFKFVDIKYLLSSQAHDDHAAGHFLVKELTGAKVLVMQGDDGVIATGGKGDFLFDTAWKPCKVDRVLHDGDKVTLGGSTLVAHLTPGHTKGCTTWTTIVEDAGRKLNVVIVGSNSINPGTKLVDNPKYPAIAEDHMRAYRVERALACDIFLAAHTGFYAAADKYKRLKAGEQPNPFIDPEGYRQYLDHAQAVFERTLAEQKAATAK